MGHHKASSCLQLPNRKYSLFQKSRWSKVASFRFKTELKWRRYYFEVEKQGRFKQAWRKAQSKAWDVGENCFGRDWRERKDAREDWPGEEGLWDCVEAIIRGKAIRFAFIILSTFLIAVKSGESKSVALYADCRLLAVLSRHHLPSIPITSHLHRIKMKPLWLEFMIASGIQSNYNDFCSNLATSLASLMCSLFWTTHNQSLVGLLRNIFATNANVIDALENSGDELWEVSFCFIAFVTDWPLGN